MSRSMLRGLAAERQAGREAGDVAPLVRLPVSALTDTGDDVPRVFGLVAVLQGFGDELDVIGWETDVFAAVLCGDGWIRFFHGHTGEASRRYRPVKDDGTYRPRRGALRWRKSITPEGVASKPYERTYNGVKHRWTAEELADQFDQYQTVTVIRTPELQGAW